MNVTWWQSLLIALIPALISAVASGFFSYFLAIKKSAKDIEQLAERHKQEMELLREKHNLEIDKLKYQQEHESKMKEQDASVNMGANIISSIITRILDSDAMKKNINTKIEEKFGEKEN